MKDNSGTSLGRKITPAHLTRIGVLSAISAVLFIFPEITIIPPIYKLDFSTLPALLAGFSLGPVSGVLVVLIKDITGLLHSSSMGVGELADFLMSASFVYAASIVYKKRHNFKGAVMGMLLGIVVSTIISALTNYYIMIPFYVGAFNMTNEAIVAMIAKAIPAVTSLWKLILFATVPFNLIKGVVLCLVTMLIYKRLSPLLHVKK